MAITYEGEVGKGTGNVSSTTLVVTVTTGRPAGALLIARVGSTGFALSSVADSKGNTWTVDKSSVHTVAGSIASTLQDVGTLVATDTITFTFAGSAGKRVAVVDAFSGIVSSAPVDKTASDTTAIGTSRDTGTTVTTTQADELVFASYAVAGVETSFTPDGSYLTPTTAFLANNASSSVEGCYLIVSATGAYRETGTGGVSANSAGQIVTYKAAAAPPSASAGAIPLKALMGVGL